MIVGLVIIGSLAVFTLAVVGWFLTTSQVPERASEHSTPETTQGTRRSIKETFGPADAGAEAMDPDLLGGDQSPPSE